MLIRKSLSKLYRSKLHFQYKGNLDGWQWEDKSELSYTNWDAGEPNDWNGQQEDCTEVLKTGDWNDDPCKFNIVRF